MSVIISKPSVHYEARALFHVSVVGAERLPLLTGRWFTPTSLTVTYQWSESNGWCLTMVNATGPKVDAEGRACGMGSVVVKPADGADYNWAREYAEGLKPQHEPFSVGGAP